MDFWFQDESRIGQRGTITRQWTRRGTRPRIPRQQQFLSGYLFGAVCPATGDSAGYVASSCDSNMMEKHLEEIAQKVPPGRHAVVILDGAAWHTSKKLQYSDRITLLPLPPYSPELNPVEQIWQKLRREFFSNRIFKSVEEIIEVCCKVWNEFAADIDGIRKLCTRNWVKA